MGEIQIASEEQGTGIVQVVESIMRMDHTTQQNAALVEEMAAAAESLNAQAQDLVQTVEFFRLDARQSSPLSAPSPVLMPTEN